MTKTPGMGNRASRQFIGRITRPIKKLLQLLFRYTEQEGWYPMPSFRFSVIIEKDEDGYSAFCPELQGCYAQGGTYEEVLNNIRDVIRLHVDDRIGAGEKIPEGRLINLTTVEVSV